MREKINIVCSDFPFRVMGLLILLLCIAQIPFVHDLFAWDRALIQSGQAWRVLTGNLTHTNFSHLAMNVSGLILLAWFHHSYYKAGSFVFMVWIMMTVIGLAMFFTTFDWYVGFSGVLHGLFVWGVIKDIQNKIPLGWALLCVIFLKLMFDVQNASDGTTAQLIDANVAYQAHWVGGILGMFFGIFSKKT